MIKQQYNIILIDNFDSFTYNLVDEIRCLGHQLLIYRNDVPVSVILEVLQKSSLPSLLVVSPGPGKPADAGNLSLLFEKLIGQVPIIGICLGFQALVEIFGGTVGHADEIMHGKISLIEHNHVGPFDNLPSPLPVARYHSLAAHAVPKKLSVIAHYHDTPMSIYSEQEKILGFQFHPESILTPHGSSLLEQSLETLVA
jgi:anthranilate synthase component 2